MARDGRNMVTGLLEDCPARLPYNIEGRCAQRGKRFSVLVPRPRHVPTPLCVLISAALLE